MSSIQNVSRKDGTYYFRRVIRLGQDKPFRIRLSLRTMDHARARWMAPAMSVASEVLRMNMMQAMDRDGLSAEQRAEIFKRQMLRERDRLAAGHAQLQLVNLGDELPIDALNLRLDAGEALGTDRANNGSTEPALVFKIPLDDDGDEPIEVMTWDDYAGSLAGEDAGKAATVHLDALGIPASPLNMQMAKRVVHQATVEAIREYRQTIADPGAAYPVVPVSNGCTGSLASVPVPAAAVTAVPAPTDAVKAEYATMTASQAAAKFITSNPRTGGEDGKARRKGKSWTDKTREQFKLPALLLEQVMNGRPLRTVTDEDLLNLDKCFNNLHGPSFRKSARQRAMTINEIVAETAELVRTEQLTEDDLGLGIGTTNRHWGFLRQLTTWFGGKHPIAALDYSLFIVDDDRDPRTLRDTYTVEEGRALFSLPPWIGCQSLTRRMQPGKIVIHDAGYFVPLIAWYTGMRREEICGLELSEVVCEDGQWHFEIKDNSVRKLKTSTSRRLVPLADELVRLRLPDYVLALREAGETLLFPELVRESGKGTMGDVYYDIHWMKVAAKLPFIERGQAMHSFRHTVADELKAQSVFEETRADLVGHRIETEMGGRYSKAARLAILRAAVAQIPQVTLHLRASPLTLLPARQRKPRPARVTRPNR